MEKRKRPISVVLGCITILLVSGSLLLRLLQRPIPTEAEIFPVFIAMAVIIGIATVIAVLIWFGKGWARWIYVLWLLVPIVFGTYAEASFLERDVSQQFTHKLVSLFTSVFGLSTIAPVVLLFLPASNRWFVHCK